MQDILQLDFIPYSNNAEVPGKNRTPGDVGGSLFRNFMMKQGDSSLKKDEISYLSKGSSRPSGIPGDDSNRKADSLEKLVKDLEDLGVPAGQITITETALTNLVSFLEKQGLGREKIDQIILSAKNRDGSVNLSKLLAGLLKDSKGAGTANNIIVHSRDLPRVEEILMKMGLGVGEVKEVIERSINKGGELSLARLSDMLGKHFSGPVSQKTLASLFRHYDINGLPQTIKAALTDPDLRKEIINLSKTTSQDVHSKIKQNIAVLLREKGIPPQEVKPLLETLTTSQAKAALEIPASQMKAPADFLNSVGLRSRSDWYKDGWQQQILNILEKEHSLALKGTNGNWFQEKGSIYLNLTDFLKYGEKNLKIASIHPSPLILKNLSSGMAINQKDETGSTLFRETIPRENSKEHPQIKNLFVNDFTTKIEKEIWKTGTENHSRNISPLPEPLPKIFDRMMWMIRGGEQRSRIFISPPELGRLDLDLVIKQGHLQAHLSAETGVVKELIEANLNQLKQQLSDQGYIVDNFKVMVGLDDRRFQWSEEHAARQRNRSLSRNAESRTHGASVEPEQVSSSIRNLYQIDLLV